MRFSAVVSRFNWPHPIWAGRPEAEYHAWLEQRLELLATYTAASLRNCYVKPDRWIILCQTVDGDLLQRLNDVAVTSGCEVRLGIYDGKSILQAIRRCLHDVPVPAQICTTRLDTDDVVSSDHFARLRAVEVVPRLGGLGTILSFPGGANFDASSKLFYYSCYPDNPFLSLVEQVADIGLLRTVLSRQHTDWVGQVDSMVSLRSYEPMWASVIHGDNVANESLRHTNHLALRDTERLRRRFGLTA